MWPFFPSNTDLNLRERALWPAPKMGYNTVLGVDFVEGSGGTTEPVTLDQLKNWGKIDVTDDDDLIEELGAHARQMVEGFLNVSIVPRTVVAFINNCNGNMQLPYGPVVELISITDYNGDAIAADNYRLELGDFKRLAYPKSNYIRLEYTAGYTTIPRWALTGIKQQFIWLYQHRGDEVQQSQMSPDAYATLIQYRRVP